ncbi:MAG: sensor histidine kinase [Alphaproteobacteria bacterium]|nr:sensor histidine kinase [Alphaproteobacteria bacterium]
MRRGAFLKVMVIAGLCSMVLPPLRTDSRQPMIRKLIAFSSIIMLLFCVIVAYQASRAYETALRNSETSATRLAHSLAGHVELTFRAVDLSLKRAAEYLHHYPPGDVPPSKEIEDSFRLWVADAPQTVAMYITDTYGNIVMSAAQKGFTRLFSDGASVASRPFFRDTREQGDVFLYVGTQEFDGARYVIMSRKYYDHADRFAGIVFAVVNPAYFSQFFRAIESGKKSTMLLTEYDGHPLLSSPGSDDAATRTVQDAIAKAAGTGMQNTVTARTTVDHALVVYSYKRLWNLPVYVAAILDEEDFLSGWSKDRVKDIGFLAIFAIFGSVLSFFAFTLTKQISRIEESEAAAVLASQAKSEFLANMSHELRTPLNAIIGFSEMIDNGYFGPLNTKQKERVRDINLCGNHLLQLINDILDFSKGDAGKMELQEEVFSVADVAEECIRIMSERARMQGVDLQMDVAVNLPPLMADKRKIRQLLLNLLSNAVKFTPEGGRVIVRARIGTNRMLVITVEDTGIGIAKEDIPKAMSVFGQVHRREHPEGTGLGLPLCRMFAELHGGQLRLESEPNVGTKVHILLPPGRLVTRSIPAQAAMAV